jgi:hypothetical protein
MINDAARPLDDQGTVLATANGDRLGLFGR